jgi:hypothetical protein
MASTRTIPKEDWRPFFDMISKSLVGQRVEVETASLDLGDQIVAEWLPLVGITYDSHNDLLDVAMVELDHLIRNPRAIVVQESKGSIESVAVEDADGETEVIRLKAPVMLPAAGAGA